MGRLQGRRPQARGWTPKSQTRAACGRDDDRRLAHPPLPPDPLMGRFPLTTSIRVLAGSSLYHRNPMEPSTTRRDHVLHPDLPTDRGAAPGAEANSSSSPPGADERPDPHGNKLRELRNNAKLPADDGPRVDAAIERYASWITAMLALRSEGDQRLRDLVDLCNEYKQYIALDLIWDSSNEFLYRQRGQTKLDNSIVEEFLPWCIDARTIPELADTDFAIGPHNAFAAASFRSSIASSHVAGGLWIRTKDQDFTIGRAAYLRSSLDSSFPPERTETNRIHLAYVAAECKTNLDKTMFQEATATAHDLKVAVPAAKYFLLVEYLDMTPVSTMGTDIDEVLILRGRRMAANLRQNFSNPAARKSGRGEYEDFLNRTPVRSDVVIRFIDHIRGLFTNEDVTENSVLERGYF